VELNEKRHIRNRRNKSTPEIWRRFLACLSSKYKSGRLPLCLVGYRILASIRPLEHCTKVVPVRMLMSTSKTFMGGAVCREFESEAPAAEEMLDWVVCNNEQFCFQMCLESGDVGGTFLNWSKRVPDSWCRDTECFGLEVDPCRGLIELTGGSQAYMYDVVLYVLVDDNEASLWKSHMWWK